MLDWLLYVALGNSLFVAVIALVAFLVGRCCRQPALVHILCIVALVKLVTPPVFPLDVARYGTLETVGQVAGAAQGTLRLTPSPTRPFLLGHDRSGEARPHSRPSSAGTVAAQGWWPETRTGFVALFIAIWFSTSGLLAVISLGRALSFHRALRNQSTAAPPSLQRISREIATRIGLSRTPRLLTSRANVAPLVWWMGGRPCVVLPKSAIAALPPQQIRLVLAHELVHIRRLDHWTRWLEWTACTLFWWNPLTWWIQRELRWAEEVCCDQWVLSLFRPRRRDYALSIVNILETLARPSLRPPAMASEINSGGKLGLRIETIMNTTTPITTPRMARILAAALAILVIPFGLAHSQDFEKVERKLRKSVEKGHLSERQANAMLELLERMSHEEEAHEHEHELHDHARQLQHAMQETREQMEMVRRRIHEMKEAVDDGELDEREAEHGFRDLEVHLRELELRMAELAREMAEVHAEQAERESHRAEDAQHRERQVNDRTLAMQERAAAHLEELRHKFREAVAAGELNAEEAEKKLHATAAEIQRKMHEAMRQQHEMSLRNRIEQRVNRMRMRLEQAVKQGEMSEEEAKEKFEHFKAEALNQFRSERDDDRENNDASDTRLVDVAEKLLAAVEAGHMSPEIAKKRFAAIRRELESARNRWVEDDDDNDDGNEEDEDFRSIRAEKLRAAAEELRRAVRDGKMSGEEVRQKLMALRKEMMRPSNRDDEDREHEMDDDEDREERHADDDDDDDHHDEDDDDGDDDDLRP